MRSLHTRRLHHRIGRQVMTFAVRTVRHVGGDNFRAAHFDQICQLTEFLGQAAGHGGDVRGGVALAIAFFSRNRGISTVIGKSR